jgi:nitroimidazol reductase NimA-like FMN-containing flavoprotein (pyridoxamine 5'-phosphate oxidase superfamily)
MTSTHNDIEVLDAATCWQLLASQEVGRLAVAFHEHPDIFPINFTADGETILFRTAEGTKLLTMAVGPAVAFEVDGYDADKGEAWSVVVKGYAHEVPVFDKVDDDIPVFPWSATPKGRFVRIAPDDVTGRRFHVIQHRPQ